MTLAGIMKSDWHLDKTVSLGVIVTIMLQGGAWVWFTSQQDARITQVERTLEQQGNWLNGQRDQILAINERTIRMEEQLNGVRVAVNSLEQYMRARAKSAGE
jgi:hypothetical protein